MSVYLHTSPSAARLADVLREHCDACGTAACDPFLSPVILVPNTHADLWLRRTWAERAGIVMNVDFPYLEKGIRESFAGDWSPVTKDVLTMAIMAELLEAIKTGEDWAEAACSWVGRMDQSDHFEEQPRTGGGVEQIDGFSGLRLWNSANQLAEYCDNYDLHRFDDPGMEEVIKRDRLQAELRQRIRRRILGHTARDRKRYLFLRDLADGAVLLDPVRKQQVRAFGLHLFAFNALSPLHLAVLVRVARESGGDLHIWQIAPLETATHTVVQRWTHAARSLARLVELRCPECVKREYPEPAGPFAGVLVGKGPESDSLRIVGAPTLQREVEMLYNSILWHLAQDPALRLREIAVFVPDLVTYRPVIDAVFAAGVASAGSSPEGGNKALRHEYAGNASGPLSSWAAGMALLVQPWEPTRERLYTLLTNPAILAGSGLARNAIETWFQALAELGSFRGETGLEGKPDSFTFAKGLTRLRLARVMSDQPWLDLVPSGACDPELAGRVMVLVEQLESTIRQLEGQRQTGSRWRKTLLALAETFLGLPGQTIMAEAGARKQALQLLRELDWLPECGFDTIAAWAAGRLGSITLPPARGGGVIVAGMQDVRPVPFRLVYLLGMGEGLFPTPWKPASPLDLLAKDNNRFPGDIEDAERDRMLFVETLLAVRQKLVISYIDRDILKDSTRYPSSLISELRQLADIPDEAFLSIPVTGWAVTPEATALDARAPDIMSDYIRLNAGMARLRVHPEEAEAARIAAVTSEREEQKSIDLSSIKRVIENPSAGILRYAYRVEKTAGEALSLEADEPFIETDAGNESNLWTLASDLTIGWLLAEGEEPFGDFLKACGRERFISGYQRCDRVSAGFFGELIWQKKEKDLLGQAEGLGQIRTRLRAALRATNPLWSPFVFGPAPTAAREIVRGDLLPGVRLRENLVLGGILPLVWLEDGGKRICLFVDRKFGAQKVANTSVLNLIPQLVVALPSVRQALGLDGQAEVLLVSYEAPGGIPLFPGTEQEACLQRVLDLLEPGTAEQAPAMLLPAKKILADDKRIPDAEGLLVALQNAEENSHDRFVLNPAQVLVQPVVPDTDGIKTWCTSMLAPWIRMLKPDWVIPTSEDDDE